MYYGLFHKITNNGVIINDIFLKKINPFLANKGNLENPEIMLQDKGNIVSDESILVTIFNKQYIVKNSTGKKPTNIINKHGDIREATAIRLICKTFKIRV